MLVSRVSESFSYRAHARGGIHLMPGRHRSRLLVLALSLAVVLAACGVSVADVTVVHVTPRVITDEPGGAGHVSASVDVPVTLDFRDTVTAIDVTAGAPVTTGQPILDLDPIPLATNVAGLQLKLASANATLERTQASLSIDQTKDSPMVPGVEAQIQEVKGQIGLDQQLLGIAQGHAPTVTSPMNGVVLAIDAKVGQSVGPGAPLAEIVDFTNITVAASLPIAVQPEVDAGAGATLSFPDFPNVTLTGVVSAVNAGTTIGGASFLVTVSAPNTAGKLIRPGMNAFVRVSVKHQAVMTLPRAAIVNIDLDPTVMVVTGQVVHVHQVQMGIDDGPYVEVLSGLQVGDVCVLVGNQTLNEGTAVRIVRDEG
jgi:RND family efflux transporter MFP subunit